MPITRVMDEQLKALLEDINAFKNGRELTKRNQQVMQKTGESLQEYVSEIEKLTNLAFSDYPANVRRIIYL
ncbi:hypothetical protein TNCV_3855681 [Trichonephila clavipes]|nr:hypothetical protein TNCV_3855681 [Trichonephila clavipes]